MTRVYVVTRKFEVCHGHRPRGVGGWAFTYGADPFIHWFNGLYSRARWHAVAEARSLGFDLVTVQP